MISVINQLAHWLCPRQPLVSLSSTNFRIVPDSNYAINPVSMKNLKEIALRNMDNWVVSNHKQCPSIGTITTPRTAPFILWLWVDDWSVSFTAAGGSSGSVSSSARPDGDSTLWTTLQELSAMFAYQVVALEVEDLQCTSVSMSQSSLTSSTFSLSCTSPELNQSGSGGLKSSP